ncbi:MAG TPA: Crp/Fnr family transcriptional regulator [Vicinamibacteria bacterium]
MPRTDVQTGLDFRSHLVERIALFRGLPPESYAELVSQMRERRVPRRQLFFAEGDPASDLVVLCAGRAKLTQGSMNGQRVILRLTGPGEVLGGLGTGIGGRHSATAEALEPSHALVWDGRTLDTFSERHPVLLRNTIRILSERLRALELAHLELASEKVPQRLAHTLLRLVAQVGRPFEGGALVSLFREELAEMTGTTLFTVSRILSEWEARGVVRPRREGVVVDDTEGLVSIAEAGEALRSGASGAGSR